MRMNQKFIVASFVTLLLAVFSVSAQKPNPRVSKQSKELQVSKGVSESKIEQDILKEIHSLRSDPAAYAKSLIKIKSEMVGKIATMPDGKRWVMQEGVSAITESIDALNKVGKLKALEYSNGLALAARSQLANLKEDMTLGHMGKDGSDVIGRLYKFGTPGKFTAENISLYSDNGYEVIMQMVIDDGLRTRVHRLNLLSTQISQVGIAFGTGKNNVGICVIVFADKFIDR